MQLAPWSLFEAGKVVHCGFACGRYLGINSVQAFRRPLLEAHWCPIRQGVLEGHGRLLRSAPVSQATSPVLSAAEVVLRSLWALCSTRSFIALCAFTLSSPKVNIATGTSSCMSRICPLQCRCFREMAFVREAPAGSAEASRILGLHVLAAFTSSMGPQCSILGWPDK